MKKIFSLIFLSFSILNCYGQMKLAGKIYVAQIGASCKDGIGMIYSFRILKFDKDSVRIAYKVNASVAPELKAGYENMYNKLTKTYKWAMQDNVLHIEHFDDYGELSMQESKLIGQDQQKRSVIFSEEGE